MREKFALFGDDRQIISRGIHASYTNNRNYFLTLLYMEVVWCTFPNHPHCFFLVYFYCFYYVCSFFFYSLNFCVCGLQKCGSFLLFYFFSLVYFLVWLVLFGCWILFVVMGDLNVFLIFFLLFSSGWFR